MGGDVETTEGGCLCGQCRYRAEGPPINVRACHCRMCQRAIGAPFNVRVLFALDRVAITGPVGWYRSSDELERGFCSICGTTMFSRRSSVNAIGITFGSLDEPDRFAPDEHIWGSSKQAWIRLDDGLPLHAAGPPA